MHHFSLVQIAGWFLAGVWQWIRYRVPDWIIRPDTVQRSPPSWWLAVKSWHDWYYCVGSDGYPLDCWYGHYMEAMWLLLGRWVDEAADYARDWALDTVRYWIGYVRGNFTTFSDWIGWLQDLTGGFLPWWASSLANAADRLYWWLPESIRGNYQSWDDLWEGIKESVKAWARDRYDTFTWWASFAWSWVQDLGTTLEAWYNDAHTWLDGFRQNAAGWVKAWLGPAWDWVLEFWHNPWGVISGYLGDAWVALQAFAQDALPFWYNLWGSYAEEIGKFWADPLGYLYDRAETFLVEKW